MRASDIRKMFSDMMRPIVNRLMLIVGRAVLEAVKDNEGVQKVKLQLLATEVREGFERFQEYGFTSHPKSTAECVVVFPGGNRDHGLVIACEDRRFRLKNLAEGEVALYTDEGDKIHFKRGNLIEISGQTKVVVSSPDVEIGSGALESVLNGATFQAAFNAHTHTTISIGSPTTPPIVPSGPGDLSTKVKAAK